MTIPVRHSRHHHPPPLSAKSVQRGEIVGSSANRVYNEHPPPSQPSKQSIISIAAAVAASPGKRLITQAFGSPTLSIRKHKGVIGDPDDASSAVEKALNLYNKTEDRMAEMRFFLDRQTGKLETISFFSVCPFGGGP